MSKDVKIIIAVNTGETREELVIPVNPETLTVTCDGNNEPSQTLKLGEITLIKRRKLRIVSWTSFFPSQPGEVYAQPDSLGADKCVAFMEMIQELKRPAELIITGIHTRMLCTVESVEYTHAWGDSDVGYTISIKEFVPYGDGAQMMSIVDSGFAGDESVIVKAPARYKPNPIYCIGDTVIVTGPCYASPNGGIPFSFTPAGIFTTQPTRALLDAAQALKTRPPELFGEKCVIINIDTDTAFVDINKNSIPLGEFIPTDSVFSELNKAEFPYQIADMNRNALGWIAKAQMTVI